MDNRDLEKLLEGLGCKQIRSRGKWLKATCPMAPWTHSSGVDKHPSFALGLEGDAKGHFGCLACNRRGTVVDLLFTMQKLSGRSYSHLMDYARGFLIPESDDLSDKLKTATYLPRPPRSVAGIELPARMADVLEAEPPVIIPESALEPFQFIPPPIMDFLRDLRGLSDDSIHRWGLCWHPGRRRVILPVRDLDGKLVCLTGRSVDEYNRPKYLHSTGFKKELYLFGEHHVAVRVQALGKRLPRLAVVEGHFDAIWLDQCGFPAVALMGTYLSAVQKKKLARFADSVVIIGDGDKAGWEMNSRCVTQLEADMPTFAYRLDEGRDPDDMGTLELRQVFELDKLPST